MPLVSKAQVRYMFSQHPEIARRWTTNYGLNYKSLPARKRIRKAVRKAREAGKISEFVFGQPGHPSPAAPLAQPVVIPPTAIAAARISTPRTRKTQRDMARKMARIAKRVKYRLKKKGYLKGKNDGEIKHPALVKAIAG